MNNHNCKTERLSSNFPPSSTAIYPSIQSVRSANACVVDDGTTTSPSIQAMVTATIYVDA